MPVGCLQALPLGIFVLPAETQVTSSVFPTPIHSDPQRPSMKRNPLAL